MNKEAKARWLTAGVLAAVALLLAGQRAGWWRTSGALPLRPLEPPRPPEPQDTIYAMLDAARTGDAAAYLDCFTGQMASTLQQSRSEMGAAAFREYLINSNKQIKGVALSEPVPLTDREVRIRVEYVYQDRNEIQQMYLEKTPAGWRIARMDAAERIKTLVPYGTPVQ